MADSYTNSFKYKLIYIFGIPDEAHKGVLKIGEATVDTVLPIDQLNPNCSELNKAARDRINSYTTTAGVKYDLLHTELAVRNVPSKDGKTQELKAFSDHDVHRILKNSRIERKIFETDSSGLEWYYIDLETAKEAVSAVKKNLVALNGCVSKAEITQIVFRPEQKQAIDKTIKYFKNNKNAGRMLWNAKMRFGKTLSTLQVIKEMKFNRSIIITHRPVVSDSWEDDFKLIFTKEDGMKFASKERGYKTNSDFSKLGDKFVYFASIQDLRGSSLVNGKYKKNDSLFDLTWDLVVVDEAHEGTQTALGTDVLKVLLEGIAGEKEGTKLLSLSGTPFNILDKYEDDAVFTWDYIQEQQAKEEWDKLHFGDPNPYADLPKMHIYTYDLGKILNKPSLRSELSDKAFNFTEFFKTREVGKIADNNVVRKDSQLEFVHKDDIISFLNLLTKEDPESNYPYSSDRYRSLFRHSLWMVPGVKEAKALKELMQSHPIFGNSQFKIINVAGEGDGDISESELATVKNAIRDSEEEGYTITISCGRLTTGVTVPEWTAVFMLSGSYSTSAANYLQTIFRVQSPCNSFGKIKTDCFVFDFAPDRALKMVADAVSVSPKAGKGKDSDSKVLGDFLNYCPVISIDGTKMVGYKTDSIMQQLKKSYAERAVRNGFEDNSIYSYDELINLADEDAKEFNDLKKIIGSSAAQEKTKDITVNKQGFSDEEREKLESLSHKKKKDLTEEEKEKLEKDRELKENRLKAISILRGISIRMPLMIFGADIDFNSDFKITDFLDDKIVDKKSWEEFMPKGVTKSIFKKFIKYYDKDVFIAAGRQIREKVKNADSLTPTERVKEIAKLFSYFKNPDKETVLTPWRVVNMHMGTVLGGYNFYDEKYNLPLLNEPRFIDKGEITSEILANKDAKILEINSKTGLYPLYLAYSIYRTKKSSISDDVSIEKLNRIWEDVLKNNVFVICKTPMAKSITKRTLAGYNSYQVNSIYYENIISDLQKNDDSFIKKVLSPSNWNIKKDSKQKMHFDAVVGNPPYQENISNKGNASLAKQLFPYFVIGAINLKVKYVSLITPSRWFTADAQDKSFLKLRSFVKENNHLRKIYNFLDNRSLFPGVSIGPVNYFLYDSFYNGNIDFYECNANKMNMTVRPLFEDGLDIVISMNEMVSIVEKVKKMSKENEGFINLLHGRNAFGIVGKESELEKISKEIEFHGAVALYCAHEVIRYVKRESISKNLEMVDKWKVFTSKGNGGAGVINEIKSVSVIGKAYVGKPNSVCTDSLIPIGPLNSETESINVKKYMSTKFLRFLVGVLKVSQNIYQNVYKFVPMQDFTDSSDIDWSQPVQRVDKQLYEKYGLTDKEISFIEEKIQVME
uniref:Eco57I restriction-modification methylase domain-containing protein n=1 Tax=Succinivibrio sp. TaxID=2053619 RepID=UPI00402AF58B